MQQRHEGAAKRRRKARGEGWRRARRVAPSPTRGAAARRVSNCANCASCSRWRACRNVPAIFPFHQARRAVWASCRAGRGRLVQAQAGGRSGGAGGCCAVIADCLLLLDGWAAAAPAPARKELESERYLNDDSVKPTMQHKLARAGCKHFQPGDSQQNGHWQEEGARHELKLSGPP